VLAREARTDSERKMWIGEIARVFADASQPDRLHAAESLAKLNVNLREIAPDLVSSDLAGSDTLMQALCSLGKFGCRKPRQHRLSYIDVDG
jgi:hypothetical protein